MGNPLDYRWSMRALLDAMNRWVGEDKAPPPSRYPRLDMNTLVAPEKLNFPKIPGVNVSARVHKAYRADYGPEFYSKGIVTNEPPKIGAPFPVLVPAVNADGNDLAGVQMPELAVPLATYTGWNLFNANHGPTDEISSMVGSFIPLARTKAEREAKKDPRLSVEERYASRQDYLGRISDSALALASEGYLRNEDVASLIRQADSHWRYLTGDGETSSGGQ
jgi:hypothetical protein